MPFDWLDESLQVVGQIRNNVIRQLDFSGSVDLITVGVIEDFRYTLRGM